VNPPVTLRGEILRLAVPAAVQNLFLTLKFFVDTKMVGDLTGEEGPGPLAAIGIVSPILWSITVVFTAITVGTTAVVARRTGERDRSGIESAVATSIAVALLLGAPVALGGWLAAEPVVALFAGGRVEAAVAADARDYLRPVLAAFPLDFFALVAMAAMRGAGDTVIPMLAGLAANVVNVALNWLLIHGNAGFPRMRVEGAGLATAIAIAVEALFLALALARGFGGKLRFAPSSMRAASLGTLRRLSRIAFPSGVEAAVFHAAFLLYQNAVFRLGAAPIAAHRVAITLESLAFMPAYGFHLAAATLAGQRLGEGKPHEASRSVTETARLGALFMLGTSLLFLALPGPLAGFFTGDAELVRRAPALLRLAALEVPFLGTAMAFSGGLRGAGETRGPLAVTALGAWLLRVPLSYLLGASGALGLVGIWVATSLDWIVRASLLAWLWRLGHWKKVVV
jgi:putative MATE family efflux protein